MPALFLLLLWPLVEIALFVLVGGSIGLWLTLLIVIGTGVLGVRLLQRLGLHSFQRVRSEMGRMRDPVATAGDGVLKALAALLLILPGFLTDILGMLLLLPPLRAALVVALTRRFGTVSTRPQQPTRRNDGIVIEGEFIEVDEAEITTPPRANTSSGWTRH